MVVSTTATCNVVTAAFELASFVTACLARASSCEDVLRPGMANAKLIVPATFVLLAFYFGTWRLRQMFWLSQWLMLEANLYMKPWPSAHPFFSMIARLEWHAPDRPAVVPPLHEFNASDFDASKAYDIAKGNTEVLVVRGLFDDAPSRSWGNEEFVRKYGRTKMVINNGTGANSMSHRHQEFYKIVDSNLQTLDESIHRGDSVVSYGIDEIFTQNPELADEVDVDRLGRGNHRQACRQLGMLYGRARAGQAGGLMYHNAISSNYLMHLDSAKQGPYEMSNSAPQCLPRGPNSV